MTRILALLILASASVPAATVTVLGNGWALNSSSTPDSAALWTVDLTVTAPCPIWDGCYGLVRFSDATSDIFASGPKTIRFSILNDTTDTWVLLPTGIYDGRVTRFYSNYFSAWRESGDLGDWVYFYGGALPPSRTLTLELDITPFAPMGPLPHIVLTPNSEALPESSTIWSAGLGIALVAIGVFRRR